MKARTLMITTGALFALAAPAAQASLERMVPAKHALAAHHKIVAKKVSKSHAATKPLYIYVPGPANQTPTTNVDPTDQELCDIWGMNCDLVSTPTIAAPQVEIAPVETLTNDTSSTQSDPVASSTSDTSSSSDPSMDSSDEDC